MAVGTTREILPRSIGEHDKEYYRDSERQDSDNEYGENGRYKRGDHLEECRDQMNCIEKEDWGKDQQQKKFDT